MLDYFFPNMPLRNTSEKEKLELAEVDVKRFRRTIRQFKLINALLSASSRLVCQHFFSIMAQDLNRSYTLLDVGVGGCDVAIRVARQARQRGFKLNITALDNDKRILPIAYQAIQGYPEIRIVEGNALDLHRLGSFDFVFSSHLLHHLAWDDIKIFMDSIVAQTRLHKTAGSGQKGCSRGGGRFAFGAGLANRRHQTLGLPHRRREDNQRSTGRNRGPRRATPGYTYNPGELRQYVVANGLVCPGGGSV